jgi:hypothetical protein
MPTACNAGIGIFNRAHDTRDTRVDQRLRTRTCLAMMGTRFK